MPLPSLRIVADAHAWGAAHAFRHFPGFATKLTVVEHAAITHALLQQADVLVTRSSTRVDARLLADTAVRFVGTATVGEDHVDKAWLAARGIAFASAAGSSTGSVVEYGIAALLALHAGGLIDLPHIRLGVVGVGRIGGRLAGVGAARGTAPRSGSQKLTPHGAGAGFPPNAAVARPGTIDVCFITAVGAPDIMAHLRSCGVAVELGPVEQTGAIGPMTSVYCRDPDGNLIEIASYLAD